MVHYYLEDYRNILYLPLLLFNQNVCPHNAPIMPAPTTPALPSFHNACPHNAELSPYIAVWGLTLLAVNGLIGGSKYEGFPYLKYSRTSDKGPFHVTVEITSFRLHHCQLCTIVIVLYLALALPLALPLAHSNSTIDNDVI